MLFGRDSPIISRLTQLFHNLSPQFPSYQPQLIPTSSPAIWIYIPPVLHQPQPLTVPGNLPVLVGPQQPLSHKQQYNQLVRALTKSHWAMANQSCSHRHSLSLSRWAAAASGPCCWAAVPGPWQLLVSASGSRSAPPCSLQYLHWLCLLSLWHPQCFRTLRLRHPQCLRPLRLRHPQCLFPQRLQQPQWLHPLSLPKSLQHLLWLHLLSL